MVKIENSPYCNLVVIKIVKGFESINHNDFLITVKYKKQEVKHELMERINKLLIFSEFTDLDAHEIVEHKIINNLVLYKDYNTNQFALNTAAFSLSTLLASNKLDFNHKDFDLLIIKQTKISKL